MDKSYRINTKINSDKVVHVNLERDVDFLEILSLKLNQEDTYKLHASSYGVVVGRVLANNGFGIQNAKVSVFIELSDEDAMNSDITNLYPYKSINTFDSEGRRYNLLPDTSTDECYKVVGTFPNKRLVLDDDSVLEVYDKYWKYTTITNKSGDYMIFGVPTGNQQIHVDVDLSDIGILSQKPRDMIYKGYNTTQFENANQFKESTNLDSLAQLISQTEALHVYPFWGDVNTDEIAITRCDLNIQYLFEPTCVFFGSVITDNYSNNIGHNCSSSKYSGFNRNLVTTEGTIEMIRETIDGLVEEYQIQGNRLIDGDGVWCYQIPMNLDYVTMDEYGNLIPSDNPNIGIPTRCRARFRFSVQETNNEGVARHRAKYLVPNNPELVSDSTQPKLPNGKKFTQCFEFGSATPKEYFRDLYWNKVYTVKNYIPRTQNSTKHSNQNYNALRTTNDSGDLNPIPFNKVRLRLVFAFRILCLIMTIVAKVINFVNKIFSFIANICLKIWKLKWCPFKLSCVEFSNGLTEDTEENIMYIPGCYGEAYDRTGCSTPGCTKETDVNELIDTVEQVLSQEYDIVNLDFYNDWLNGTLYMPLWYWKKTKKKKFLFGLFTKKATNAFCNCDKLENRYRIIYPCSLDYNNDKLNFTGDSEKEDWHQNAPSFNLKYGVIKEVENDDGLKIYYYTPGNPISDDYKTNEGQVDYIRLFSTDIVNLGSLNSCDMDGLPQPFLNLPSTTANIPYIATIQEIQESEDGSMSQATSTVEITGMDWGHDGTSNKPKYGRGLFLDLGCSNIRTKAKTCINLERMCELGVSMDMYYKEYTGKGGSINEFPITADGMITRYELDDNETRAMFASLNYAKATNKILNKNTGYYSDKFKYIYPIDFDGRMSSFAPSYSSGSDVKTYDYQDMNYMNFRFGTDEKRHFYGGTKFPVYDNSFYFYFGLHEGSTAIDKFNSMFFATCYQNKKYPFLMEIDKTPGKWCYNKISPNTKEDFGIIEVNLDGIRTPYSYELLDTNGNTIIEESNMYNTVLVFGAEIAQGGGSYVLDGEGKYRQDGVLKYFNSGLAVTPTTYLTNGTYSLKITDNKGQTVTQIISLEQNSINMTYTVSGLGSKFYDLKNTKQEDICNDQQFYGEIRISNFIIDGQTYAIPCSEKDKNKCIKSLGDGKYQIYLGENNQVLLQISPLFYTSGEEYNFNTCLCNEVGNVKGYEISDLNELVFNMWIPGDYQIVLTQYCYDQLNDNTTTFLVTVDNGSPFNVLINQVPLRFILGKLENANMYNSNFWKNNVTQPSDLQGWFSLHNAKMYAFPGLTTESDINVWSEFISDLSYDSDNNLSSYSKTSIIEYKLQSLFNMSYGCYITEDTSASIQLTTNGGKKPILIKSVYPDYSSLNGDEDSSNDVEYIIDSNGYVICDTNYPNIVGKNYSYTNANIQVPFNWDATNGYFNPLFNPTNKLGNYFAAFTQNGGFVIDGDGNCQHSSSIKYQKIPDLANSVVTEDTCGSSSGTTQEPPSHLIYKTTSSNPYFRGEFVDRRLDYDLIFITPYMGDGDLGLVDNAETWRLGRISGTTFNGVEMAYDNSLNIVSDKESDGLEYYYNISDASLTFNNSNTANLKRNLYNATLKCGSTNVDLKPFFWTKTNKKPSAFGLNGVSRKNESEPFYFDHANDNFYNGNFDSNNYPTIRLLDIGNLPNGNKYTLTLSSCSYANLVVERTDVENSDIQKLSVYIDEGDDMEVSIDCRNMVNMIKTVPDDGSFNEAAYNALYECVEGNNTSTLTFKGYAFKCDFTISEDSYNDTHNIQTQIPKIVTISLDNNCFLHKLKTVQSVSELESVINNNGEKCNASTPDGCYWEGDVLYYNDTDPKERVFDDSQEFKKVTFSSRSSTYVPVNKTWSEFKLLGRNMIKAMKINNDPNMSYLLIYFQRFYYNNSADFLYKYMRVIECGSLIDTRPFRLQVVKSEMVENGGTIEVPSEGEDTGSTEEGGEATTTTEPTYNLKTTFKLLFNNNNENKSFIDAEKVGIKYVIDVGKFRVASEASEVRYIEEEGALSFSMLWDGDLANITPTISLIPPTIKMYITSPNNNTYAISFKIPNEETITRLIKDDDF